VVPHHPDDQLDDDEEGDGDGDAGRVQAELVVGVRRRLRRDLDAVVGVSVDGADDRLRVGGVDVVDFPERFEFLKSCERENKFQTFGLCIGRLLLLMSRGKRLINEVALSAYRSNKCKLKGTLIFWGSA